MEIYLPIGQLSANWILVLGLGCAVGFGQEIERRNLVKAPYVSGSFDNIAIAAQREIAPDITRYSDEPNIDARGVFRLTDISASQAARRFTSVEKSI